MVLSTALVGATAVPVRIEVELLQRLPCIVIVGLPGSSVRECAARVRAAILASGFTFPRARVVVTVTSDAPRVYGTALDLPIALAILEASGQVALPAGWSFVGELALNGTVRPVRGTLATAAVTSGELVVPADNGSEAASMARGVRAIRHLSEARKLGALPVVPASEVPLAESGLRLADVRGQDAARVALRACARARTPVLFVGPPGCVKSMLAARMPLLLDSPTLDERRRMAIIRDAAGFGPVEAVARPFRAPHHSCSLAALIGGNGRQGEADLARGGVLFLDDADTFARFIRESLVGRLDDVWLAGAVNTDEEAKRVLRGPLFRGAVLVRPERMIPSILLGGAA